MGPWQDPQMAVSLLLRLGLEQGHVSASHSGRNLLLPPHTDSGLALSFFLARVSVESLGEGEGLSSVRPSEGGTRWHRVCAFDALFPTRAGLCNH